MSDIDEFLSRELALCVASATATSHDEREDREDHEENIGQIFFVILASFAFIVREFVNVDRR